LRFITEELGFESDVDAFQFIIDHGGENLMEQRDDTFVFLAGKAGAIFETAKSTAFSRVDLRGQI
jgi:SAC3 family protein LENG8/THP3